jgi:hypothetical protein
MGSGPRTLDGMSAPSRGSDAESIDSYLDVMFADQRRWPALSCR